MVDDTLPRRYRLPRSCRSVARRMTRRMGRLGDLAVLVIVLAVVAACTVWAFLDYRNVRVAPIAVIVLVLGSLVLSGRNMVIVIAALTVAVVLASVFHTQLKSQLLSVSGVVMLLSVAAVAVVQTRRRDALGLRGMSAESVLEQVRGRVRAQSAVPVLPAGWRLELTQHAAGRAAFAGDFVMSRLHEVAGEPILDTVVVDVSGRGFAAGSRALLLSGAVGGLLGEVPADHLLPALNDYLIRQDWGSDFATAIYVRLTLSDGRYEIRCAGHPPALRWSARDATVTRSLSTGTLLGVVVPLQTTVDTGRLTEGDALILYTDGLVERRDADIDTGITRLQVAVRAGLSTRPPAQLAPHLVEVGDQQDDDVSVVVLFRDAG